jgi:hypothetical protein
LWAAVTSQGGPGRHILYQDVALEPNVSHQLSLFAYYRSDGAMVTPSPATLSFEVANQQYRIDVVKPGAPIDTVDPADILTPVFATNSGDPLELAPTPLSVNLTPFAGQTVRLRFAEVDTGGFLAASTDSVSILSTSPIPPPPSNAFAMGKPVLNKKKGTAKLPVTVPGAGTLTIADAKAKGKKRIKAKTVKAVAAGSVNLPVKPTKSARNTLREKGKLSLRVAVTFTPTGGTAATQTRKVVLKLKPAPPK